MRVIHRPLISLQEGCWFKLIGGASYQHLPSIRNLALAYALAGADCIDVAADPAVVKAVKEAFSVLSRLQQQTAFIAQCPVDIPTELPLLMVSFSDGDDPHFRKAQFDPQQCPADCSRPCEAICPAAAIAFEPSMTGVIEARCYGCGRCLPVCPIQQIETVTRATSAQAVASALLNEVDAIEIHTQVGRYDAFMALWSALQPYLNNLTVISISCPEHDDAIAYLWQLYEGIQPLSVPLIWQTDGRSMSGDIGKGTTHATLRFAEKVLRAGPPGYVQLAGGTNAYTVAKLREATTTGAARFSISPSLVATIARPATGPTFAGVGYGSFARRLLSPLLDEGAICPPLAAIATPTSPGDNSDDLDPAIAIPQLLQAVQLAQSLVAPLKAIRRPVVTSPQVPLGEQREWVTASTEPPVYRHSSRF